MVIRLGPELEAALNDLGRRLNVAPEVLVLNTLREKFLASALRIEPQDDWERRLLGVAKDCGISLSDSAVSSEGLYE